MKKIFIIVLLAVSVCPVSRLRAQEQFPSKEQIAAVAADTTQYNALLQRFLSEEDILTPEEAVYLYYGFAMQDAFRGYLAYEKIVKSIEDLLKQRNVKQAEAKCEQFVSDFPASPTAWWLCYLVSSRSGESPEVWRKYYRNMTTMTDAILCSGDGKTRGTAFKVITQSDEYRVMYSLEIKRLRQDRENHGSTSLFRVYPSERFTSKELWFDKTMAGAK